MKILVATDGSPHAHRTLEGLLYRLDWFRDTPAITLIYVHLALPYPAAAHWVGKEVVHRYYDDESDQALADARALLESRRIAHTVEKRVGDPAHELVSYAASHGYDLIVMGTHGHTALANLVMGSVATKVLASSKVPVLLFR
jgi:nucleotide-binding universal stress UspA family protein